MDILGTKRLVAIIERATGAVIPQTGEVLAKLSLALDEAKLTVLDFRDLVGDLDGIVEGLPTHVQALVKAGLSLAAAGERVAFRASGVVQSFSQGVRLDAAGLRIGDYHISGGVVITPKEKSG